MYLYSACAHFEPIVSKLCSANSFEPHKYTCSSVNHGSPYSTNSFGSPLGAPQPSRAAAQVLSGTPCGICPAKPGNSANPFGNVVRYLPDQVGQRRKSLWERRAVFARPSRATAQIPLGFAYLSLAAATPGSSLPSRNSREAPPPVEMWLILSPKPS